MVAGADKIKKPIDAGIAGAATRVEIRAQTQKSLASHYHRLDDNFGPSALARTDPPVLFKNDPAVLMGFRQDGAQRGEVGHSRCLRPASDPALICRGGSVGIHA